MSEIHETNNCHMEEFERFTWDIRAKIEFIEKYAEKHFKNSIPPSNLAQEYEALKIALEFKRSAWSVCSELRDKEINDLHTKYMSYKMASELCATNDAVKISNLNKKIDELKKELDDEIKERDELKAELERVQERCKELEQDIEARDYAKREE